jgi:UDP-N-acetylglucosamine--N-acetylmuramyl-(pentapeptide) pyrophosphoryl-undecaprenol N-acetylglucosamine transferase
MTSTLLVANDGGHIMQLSSLVDRSAEVEDRIWVTVATPQTESLLAGERVCWVGEAPTRDWRAVGQNAVKIRKLFRSETIDRAISTGSSLALSALPQAALRRIPAHYIESVTRTDGFSLSGRILQRIPGISLYTQWPHLATPRWQYSGSVLDGFESRATTLGPVTSVVVSLGTSGRFGFRRLLERLLAIIPTGVEVLWQTGSTDVSGLGIDARTSLPALQLSAAIEAADAVVAHAGAGISLTALQAGKIPLLAPRLASQGEHVDDHQTEIARYLNKLDLAVVADADEVTWDLLTSMTARRAVAVAEPERFQLQE